MELYLNLLKPSVELRDYQLLAAQNALAQNTLVVMPTALGKTFVAVLLSAHFLQAQPEKKVLFLAPTKPLVEQQAQRFKEALSLTDEAVSVVTGEVSPAERDAIYFQSKIVVGTPQTCEHDVLARKLALENFSLIVVDEAHRAVGDYAYVFLGKQIKETTARVLALTASPSSQKEKIEEICSNLGISHIELRQERDIAVQKYAQPVRVQWVFVDLPHEFRSLQSTLREMLSESLSSLKELGFLQAADLSKTNKKDMLQARGKIASLLPHNPTAYAGLSLVAKSLNLSHALELLEAQGVQALSSFLRGLSQRKQKTRAVRSILEDFRTQKLLAQCDELLSHGLLHPKIERLEGIVREQASRGKVLIIFAHFKNTVSLLVDRLNALQGVSAKALVGRSGMTQKKQKELLNAFRAKEFNVLTCTSVGEEGLDIPAVDSVIFYEAVPSEIRLIQRRGRAGRLRAGNAIVLVAKNTKDEAFFWISKKKEKKMHALLEEYSRALSEARNAQRKLFTSEETKLD